MPPVHDRQSAKELIAAVLWWENVFKRFGRWFKKRILRKKDNT